jgi:predicted MarR family transcription regulator
MWNPCIYCQKQLRDRFKNNSADAGSENWLCTNVGGILHHSARERKRGKTLKIVCFVICIEDYHKRSF